MGNIKEIKIKHCTYYFFNDMINIDDFDPKLLKIKKKSIKINDIYYIGYTAIKKIDDNENIHNVNLLHLVIGKIKWIY